MRKIQQKGTHRAGFPDFVCTPEVTHGTAVYEFPQWGPFSDKVCVWGSKNRYVCECLCGCGGNGGKSVSVWLVVREE